jgi:hypothetical protein
MLCVRDAIASTLFGLHDVPITPCLESDVFVILLALDFVLTFIIFLLNARTKFTI